MRFDKKTVSLGIMTQAIFKSFRPKAALRKSQKKKKKKKKFPVINLKKL